MPQAKKKAAKKPESTIPEWDLAPDADEPGDDLPEELQDLVTPDDEELVPDQVDHKEQTR
jgi:hypothetical protein